MLNAICRLNVDMEGFLSWPAYPDGAVPATDSRVQLSRDCANLDRACAFCWCAIGESQKGGSEKASGEASNIVRLRRHLGRTNRRGSVGWFVTD